MSSPPIVEELTSTGEWVVCDTPEYDQRQQPSAGTMEREESSQPELSKLSTKQLKQLLKTRGIDYSDCVEKDDLVARLVQCHRNVPPASSGAPPPVPNAKPVYANRSSSSTQVMFKSMSKGIGRSFRKVVRESKKATSGMGSSLKNLTTDLAKLAGFGFGSIHIEVPRRRYHWGENIQGHVKLNLEQPVQATELVVSLIGTQRIRDGSDRIQGDEHNKVYDFPVKLENERVYSPGENFSFDLPIPSIDTDSTSGSALVGLALGLFDGLMLDQWADDVEWSVAAELRLTASFVPLGDSVRILVEEIETYSE